MSVLVTGASGFVGTALIENLLEKGHKVYGLSRHPPIGSNKNLVPVKGDILLPDLGMGEVPGDIHAIHHVAGLHRLGEDKDGSIWQTNVKGTQNVLDFCVKNGIRRVFFTSTAYTWECNPYGCSKIQNEEDVREYSRKYGLKTTIFKPSVIMGTEEHPYPGHFSQFVKLLIKIHQRGEIVRRKLEGTLRLPVLEPVFRVKGNPEGKLNLIQIDQVVSGMANIEKTGTFWLTHPDPPTLQQLCDWTGELIMVKVKVEPEFKPTPIEATFQKIASAFSPYLQGDSFPSDLETPPPIDRDFIINTIKQTLS